MDPTAPDSQDPQNPNPNNPIMPGQFIVAGEDVPNPPQPTNPSPAQPAFPQTTPATPISPLNTNIPPHPASPPATNPGDLLATLAKQTEGAILPQNQTDIHQPSQVQPSVLPAPTASEPPREAPAAAEPVLNLASDIPLNQSEMPQTAGLDITPPLDNAAPDPTPYAPPPQGPPPSQEGSKMDKIKIVLMSAGVLVLIGLIASLAWFFVLNKPKGAAKTEIAQEELIEDLPAIPKRTQGGFGDLPVSTSSGSQLASPSPSPIESESDITLPDLTGL